MFEAGGGAQEPNVSIFVSKDCERTIFHASPCAPVQDSGGLALTLAQMHDRHGGPGGGVHRGGVYHGGHNVVRGGHNTVVVGGRGAWGRGYRWAPGGAIAAGAAVGFLAAGAAVAYTSTRPPAPGLCWYYRDPSYTSGFWDVCP